MCYSRLHFAFGSDGCIVAVSASRFVLVFLSENDERVVFNESV